MRLISLTLIAISFLYSFNTQAQKANSRLLDLPLNSLEAFSQSASNWQIIGDVSGSYSDTILNTAKGTGMLYNAYTRAMQFNSAHWLFSKIEHGDILLEFDFMIPKGSNSGIYLQSRYEVQINDSWGVKLPKHGDLGGIYERWKDDKGYEGKAPLKNASLAPGLWQHMEISFQAPRFDASGKKTQSAKFIYVKVNGITVHENIIVSGPTRAAAFEDEKAYAPIAFQGDHGVIAIKNLRYAEQEELKVGISGIQYAYFEKSAKTPEQAAKTKPTSSGTATALDSRLASARDLFYLQFEGKLKLPVKDNYTFSMLYSGDASLEIDGKQVIAPTSNYLSGYPIVVTTMLDAGEHQFKLWIYKDLSWSPPGLSLFIEKPNSRAVALHTPASMPERIPAPLIAVQSDGSPELVRSFMAHNNRKLTHVLSVGDPHQVHYAYDLLQGGILQVWKGDFLNTTEMWYERGEPQTASAMGAVRTLKGNCPIYNPSLTKDSVVAYQYKGYTLGGNGLPTFKYEYQNLKLHDEIQPMENRNGLSRTITIEGSQLENTKIRIAQGATIKQINNGVYVVGDQAYFISMNGSLSPTIENYLGEQVLVIPAKEKIQYNIIW
jgi:hypothetical protein